MECRWFSAWEVMKKGLPALFSGLDESEAVWRGEDGSYVVGDIMEFADYSENDDTTEYLEDGTVGDYTSGES